ncbi:peroxisomal d3,d2-enoyl-CoA isomerase [Clohesyomyces aquaticus]|uniref:Peroxisomal d3,d2-enoyl-CoA isomerase n=1 Tax=Clohesyomyces aquaticus TaxID=1231657 RepID=A0A1Y1YCE0_9PLEO|nr:peroxisomal d3,d2-enoyl-CoA isomerase [Clohesyomyces aquaticus]
MEEPVSTRYQNSIAIITLNKPSKLNSLTKDELYTLATILREIDARPEILITLLIGRRRFFSAGASISQARTAPEGTSPFRLGLRETVANNLNLTNAFSTHSKILVTALNGPVVGISAAIIAFSDFIYATPSAYLLTSFSSLGLVAEGGASHTFFQRMGMARAKEALFVSNKIGVNDLVQCGFVNKVFVNSEIGFEAEVLKELEGWADGNLNADSILMIKELTASGSEAVSKHIVDELFAGLGGQVAGIPQREFERLKRGEKRHKL